MSIQNTISNFVILAKHVRPSMLGEQWLISNGVINSGSAFGNRIATDEVAALSTGLLELVATQGKIQISLANASASTFTFQDLIQPIVSLLRGIEQTQPQISAVGINHNWQLTAADITDIDRFVKESLAPPNPVSGVLAENGAFWGTTAHRRWTNASAIDFRLRLKLVPIFRSVSTAQDVVGVMLESNFHLDIASGTDAISQAILAAEQFSETALASNHFAVALAGTTNAS